MAKEAEERAKLTSELLEENGKMRKELKEARRATDEAEGRAAWEAKGEAKELVQEERQWPHHHQQHI